MGRDAIWAARIPAGDGGGSPVAGVGEVAGLVEAASGESAAAAAGALDSTAMAATASTRSGCAAT